jgi:tetratricopeptide (TPR) repeat protein
MKNIENSLVALIDRKINNEMLDQESKQFEELIDSDPSVKEDLHLQMEIEAAIGETDVIDIRKNLDNVFEITQTEKEQPSIIRSLFKSKLHRIAAAAFTIIIMLGAASIFLLNTQETVSNENLFNIYYQPDAALLIRGTSEDKLLIEGFKKYENKDYSGALIIFNQILNKDPNNIPVQFYAGISNIETGKYRNALKPFNYIVSHNHNLYVEKAKWYAALCYLKLNDENKAKEFFKEISTSNSSYKYKAKNIIKSLKE